MKTQLAVYDPLGSPSPLAWLEEYDQLLILVKIRRRPIGLIRLTSRNSAFVPRSRILQEVEHQLSVTPAALEALRPATDDSALRPPISVIVCTRDRPQQLGRCLDSLSRLVYDVHEVIVVDSASRGDDTRRIVQTLPFRYVREDVPGLDRARNRGLAYATHPIVAYVDDDVVVDPHWLAGIADGFESPSVAAVTGLVLPLELETRAQHLFERYGNGMNKGMEARSFQRAAMSFQDLVETQRVGVGANMAFRREVLRGIGGFDEALDVGTAVGGCGDLDAFHRIIMHGSVIRYEPSALAWHRHRPRMRQLRDQLHTNGLSYGVYLMKRWRDGKLSRLRLAWYMVWRRGRWLIGRLVLGIFGRHRLPLHLLWAELQGALEAPRAYLTSYRSAGRRDGASQPVCESARPSSPQPLSRVEPFGVSVVVPAHNAAATLGEALESLLAQTHISWQAIVVDDGSTDSTAAVASSYAARDGRIELLQRNRGGTGAARNAGLQRARHDWLLFLDADDWLDPRHLEMLTARARSDPALDVVCCGWASLTADGEVVEEGWPPGEGNLFDHFARYCAIPTMSAIVRRERVEKVGGFDQTLQTCQDWDLWQRLARAGAVFGAVREVLAYYRVRRDSSSADERRVLTDGLRVIRRGHTRDHRGGASPANGAGRPRRWLAPVELYWVCWAAGLALGHGRAPTPLLAAVADSRALDLDADDVADVLFRSVLRATAEPPSSWGWLYPRLAPQLSEYLTALEAHSGTPDLARRTLFNIERRANSTPDLRARQEGGAIEAG